MQDYSKFNFSPEMQAKLGMRAALGDIVPAATEILSALASRQHQVVAGGTPPAILAGEPVSKTLGNQYVITNPSSGQAVATNFLAGVATTTSTETASANGTVDVTPIDEKIIWLISPTVPATWGLTQGALVQATYNALAGARVLIQKSGGIYTILATDSATNGCVVENLNINTTTGKVAFSFRAGLSYLA